MTHSHLGRAILVVALALLGAACAPSNHVRFQGVWAIDIDRMIEKDTKMQEQLKQNPGMRKMLEDMMGTARITVDESTLEMTMGQKTERATYKVVSDTDDTLVFESTDEGKEDVEELTATFESDDVLTMTKKGDPDSIVLKRAEPAKK